MSVTYIKEKIIKVFHKSCYLEFLNVTYMRTNFFSQWLYFYNFHRLLNEHKKKGGIFMAYRKRNKQIIVRVTEEERELIELKMAQLPTAQLGAYMRKMAIDGYIILLDIPEIKKHTAELSAIGRNINIIAKRICQNVIYEQDIKDIKSLMDEIWKSERKLLSHFLNIKK